MTNANSDELQQLGRQQVRGKVKWFSVDKGYGFIVGDDQIERHFSVRNVQGADLPKNGDVVEFEHEDGKKGARADKVQIVARAPAAQPRHFERQDDRVTCAHCHKKMVPRIITDRSSLSRSVCPFCGGTHKDFGWCFIATAVYGEDSFEVAILRRFRDNSLRATLPGRLFIRLYYHTSPPIARLLQRSPTLSRVTRRVLDRLVKMAS